MKHLILICAIIMTEAAPGQSFPPAMPASGRFEHNPEEAGALESANPIGQEEIYLRQMDEDSDTISGQSIIHTRPARSYEPLPMRHPVENHEVSPDEIIQVEVDDPAHPGQKVKKQMTAADYYKALNKLEQGFNNLGHSIRDSSPTDNVMAEVPQNKVNLTRDLAAIKDAAIAESESWKEKFNEIKDYLKGEEQTYKTKADLMVRDIFRKSGVSPEVVKNLKFAPLDQNLIHQADPKLYSIMSKSWAAEAGQKERFGAEARAGLSLFGDMDKLEALANGWFNVYVLNNEINIVAASAVARADSSEGGKGSDAGYVVTFLGNVYERWPPEGETASGRAPEKDLFSKYIREGKKYNYAIGPIPMSSEIGVVGKIGLGFQVGYEKGRAEAAVIPSLDIRGFGNAAADIEVAAAGMETELTVIEDELKLAAYAEQDLDQTDNTPFIRLGVNGTNEVKMLSGYMYAFVSYYDPTSFRKKRKVHKIFDYEGLIADKRVLFSFERQVNRKGQKLTGRPTKADSDEIELDKKITEALQSGIRLRSRSDDGERNVRAQMAALKDHMNRFNQETASWLNALDKEIRK